jgi:hypothetical protein
LLSWHSEWRLQQGEHSRRRRTVCGGQGVLRTQVVQHLLHTCGAGLLHWFTANIVLAAAAGFSAACACLQQPFAHALAVGLNEPTYATFVHSISVFAHRQHTLNCLVLLRCLWPLQRPWAPAGCGP